MQFLQELWLPIVVSGVAVFILSALAWTALPHHRTEWRRLDGEDAVLDALRASGVTPGLYTFPYAMGPKELGQPEIAAKFNRGPVGYITVGPSGMRGMGPMMLQSLVFYWVVAVFVAYIASHTLAADAEYLAVFRVVGTLGFMAFAFASVPESIWFGRPWRSFLLQCADALVFSLVMAGIFGWLW